MEITLEPVNTTNTDQFQKLLPAYLANLLMLFGGMLVAVQFRLNIHLGMKLGTNYKAHFWELYFLIALLLLVAYYIAWEAEQVPSLKTMLNLQRQFRILVVAVILINIAPAINIVHLSELQMFYFTLASLFIGGMVIVVPGRLIARQPGRTMSANLRDLWEYRGLLRQWLKYNIQQRYSQTILGILWIVLIPLSYALILDFAFSQILEMHADDVPFISFFLSGLVVFGLFNQSIHNSTQSVLRMLGLVSQVYFPREILILVALGEGLVDFFFMFLALLLLNLPLGLFPNANFIYLIPVLITLILLTAGLMFFLGAVSVLVRDIPQLVGVALQLIFFATPVIYPVERMPEKYEFLLIVNPIAPIVMSFRDITVYNRPPDFLNLCYPFVLSIVCLYVGYVFFKSKEDLLADFR